MSTSLNKKIDLDNVVWEQEEFNRSIESNDMYAVQKYLNQSKKTDTLSIHLHLAIIKASTLGLLDMVKLLMEYKKFHLVDKFNNKNNPIQYAARNGHIEIVKFLLENKDFTIEVGDNITLRNASKNGHFDIVKLLLNDDRIDPSAYYNFAILVSNDNHHKEITEFLWNDIRVKNTLQSDDIDLYNELIKIDIQNKVSCF